MEIVASLTNLNLGKFDFLAPVHMSGYGYKQTYSGQLANVCFTPKSGH